MVDIQERNSNEAALLKKNWYRAHATCFGVQFHKIKKSWEIYKKKIPVFLLQSIAQVPNPAWQC